MAPVRMHIDKFNGVVLIDEDHPLAVAQRTKAAAVSADTHQASAPAAPETPAPEAPPVDLSTLTKAQLIALAAERYDLTLDASNSKAAILAAVLEQQSQHAAADGNPRA